MFAIIFGSLICGVFAGLVSRKWQIALLVTFLILPVAVAFYGPR